MGSSEKKFQGFLTPPPKWKSNRCLPVMPRSERKPWSSVNDHQYKNDLFHVIHKVPAGDSPYVKAKHVQVIDKNPNRAVSMFWAAINAGDRVDSALKDMAIVMKQLDRSDEAIEAIKSFRDLCPLESQESLDNILIELYKKSGRIEEEVQMLQAKIKNIEEGTAFNGKRTRIARSQGKKIQITIEKEYSRLLGNLAWALMQLEDFKSAEDAYRKALLLEPDKNKHCNLAICLVHLNKLAEAKFLLDDVSASCKMDESHVKSFERATQILDNIVSSMDREEEGVCGEVHTAFPLSLSSKGFTASANGDQNDLPRSERFLRSQYVHHDEWEPLHERKDSAWLQHYNESSANFLSSSQVNLRGKYCGRRYENQFRNGRIEGESCMKMAHVSPDYLAGTPRVPFTQPRKCLWPVNGDQRTSQIVDGAVGGCNRKLTFQQHKDCEDSQFSMAAHNHDSKLKSAGTKASTCESCRKVMTEHSCEHAVNSIPNQDCKSNVVDELQNAANNCNLPSEVLVNCAITSLMKQISIADRDQSSTSVAADDSFPEASKKCNQNQKSAHQPNTNSNDFSKRRKSWAELVEEDEQLLFTGRENFSDENFNTNIVSETPLSLKHCPNLKRKDGSSGFKYGYYTQPLHDTASLNQAMGKHFSFHEHQKLYISANCADSPLRKRVLNFQRENSTPFREEQATPNGVKLMKKNRLQVFRNITPESPRC